MNLPFDIEAYEKAQLLASYNSKPRFKYDATPRKKRPSFITAQINRQREDLYRKARNRKVGRADDAK